jgi:hypothetical protein
VHIAIAVLSLFRYAGGNDAVGLIDDQILPYRLPIPTKREAHIMTKAPSSRKPLKSIPPPPEFTIAKVFEGSAAPLTLMNFRVSEAFHREFKTYAAQHGMSMVDLLRESFEVFRTHRGS